MGERPILFSAPMVLALLAGTKTQTRRVVKLRGAENIDEHDVIGCHWPWSPEADDWVPSPYGRPGDRLWVKETFAPCDAPALKGHVHYRADGAVGLRQQTNGGDSWWARSGHTLGLADKTLQGVWVGPPKKWKPSIFMTRKASRITLEVTSVRVERLQEISEADAKAEGVKPFFEKYSGIGLDQRITSGELAADAPFRASYAVLWDTINGAESWTANPWVWVVEFKRHQLRDDVGLAKRDDGRGPPVSFDIRPTS